MSEAKDKFFELLVPRMEEKGFVFKKGKGAFNKVENGICYGIVFSWDGRGGTTLINNCWGEIEYLEISKAIKKLTGISGFMQINENVNNCHWDNTIPTMYSKQLLDLANNMAFKKMAAMSFEEKYPIERIQKCVERVENIITDRIVPNFNLYKSSNDFYKYYSNLVTNTKEENLYWFNVLLLKLFSKLTNSSEPEIIKSNRTYLKEMESYNTVVKLGGIGVVEKMICEYKFNEIKEKGHRAPE
jgi:hypothetical protein